MRRSATPPNELGAQLRATAPPWLARSAYVRCETLSWIDSSALWLVSCSALLARYPAGGGNMAQGISMTYRRFKRWLYTGNGPGALARLLNRAWAIAHARGIAPDYLVTLEVAGRRSGRTISFPLVMASVDGERYLVSMLGTEVAWVRNVKAAAGRAVLRHGRTEQVRLEELPPERRAPVLKAYLQRAPGARPHIPVAKDAPIQEFEVIAGQIPVFRVLPAG